MSAPIAIAASKPHVLERAAQTQTSDTGVINDGSGTIHPDSNPTTDSAVEDELDAFLARRAASTAGGSQPCSRHLKPSCKLGKTAAPEPAPATAAGDTATAPPSAPQHNSEAEYGSVQQQLPSGAIGQALGRVGSTQAAAQPVARTSGIGLKRSVAGSAGGDGQVQETWQEEEQVSRTSPA